MFKKSVSIVVVISMLMIIAIACSKDSKPKATTTPTGSTVPKDGDGNGKYKEGEYTLPIVNEPLELVWMGRDTEDAGKSFLTNKSIIWERFEEETGIKIKWDVAPFMEYTEVMQLRLASQTDLPDIIAIEGSADGSHLVKYYEDGILMPMNDLIDKYAPNLKRMLEENPEYKQALTLPDGSIVALGHLTASNLRTKAVMIRKDWLDKLGLPEVKTPDDLLKAAKAFVNEDPNGNNEKDEFGIMTHSLGNYRQIGMMFGLSLVSGSGWSVRDGKVTYEFTLPAYKAYLEWMNTAYKEGLIPKDFQTADNAVVLERMYSDRLGIRARDDLTAFIGHNDPEQTTQENIPGSVWMPINFEDSGYGVAFPSEPKAVVWRSYGITTKTKDPIAAIRLLDYIMAGEGATTGIYGIEGITYNMVNGKPVRVPNLIEAIDPNKFFGSDYAPRIDKREQHEALFEAKYLNENAELKEWSLKVANDIAAKTYSPFQPPIPSAENALRINNIFGDLNTYRDEMFVKFVTGEVSLDQFDDYVKKINTLGAEEIATIYQAGYDNLKK